MPDITLAPPGAHQTALPDNPDYSGYVQPSWWNSGVVASGGTHQQVLQYDTSSATTKVSSTAEPHADWIVFPSGVKLRAIETGGVVSIQVMKVDTSIVSIDL